MLTSNWKTAGEVYAETLIDIASMPDLARAVRSYDDILYDRPNDRYCYMPKFDVNSKEELHKHLLGAAGPVDIVELRRLCVPEIVARLEVPCTRSLFFCWFVFPCAKEAQFCGF